MLTHYSGMDPDSPNVEAIRAGMGRAHPLGRAIDPRDAAAAAMFLCSDLASNITGVNLPVDGGLTAGRISARWAVVNIRARPRLMATTSCSMIARGVSSTH
jgi:hypothetical protein